MARHVTRRNQGRPDTRIIHPVRDWLVGLSVAVLIFIAASGYAGWLFFIEKEKDANTYVADVEVITYERELIDRVLATYRAKDVRFSELGVFSFAPASVSSLEVDGVENTEEEDASLPPDFQVE